jgi:hypothetical protein
MDRRTLAKLAQSVGVMVLDQGHAVSADAPPGFVLAGLDVHSTTVDCMGWRRHEVYAEIADRIAQGIRPCVEEDCDACSEALPFDEIKALYRGDEIA